MFNNNKVANIAFAMRFSNIQKPTLVIVYTIDWLEKKLVVDLITPLKPIQATQRFDYEFLRHESIFQSETRFL